VVDATPRPLYPQGREPVPIVQQSGWDPEAVWADVEDFALPETDPRTFQHVTSPYNDYAIPAPYLELGDQNPRNCTVLHKSFRIENYYAAGSSKTGSNTMMEWRAVQHVPAHNGEDNAASFPSIPKFKSQACHCL
jgi:hypothetical protein